MLTLCKDMRPLTHAEVNGSTLVRTLQYLCKHNLDMPLSTIYALKSCALDHVPPCLPT
jgi:hypothetical protein